MSLSLGQNYSFWDQALSDFQPYEVDPIECRTHPGLNTSTFYALLGDLAGKKVLDVGCGNGHLSVYMAKMGAHVTAIDTSMIAVHNALQLAAANGVTDKVQALQFDAMRLPELNEHWDLIAGKFVLHHIEPFDAFVDVLADCLNPGGRIVFLENNGSNPLLMFIRRYIVGRFGIPKYGDEEETPFTGQEIGLINRRFSKVERHMPELFFFRLLGIYILRRPSGKILERLDNWAHRWIPPLRRFGYHQLVSAVRD